MEKLRNLLFELSSSERMSIMLEIKKQKLKLSHVSKELDMTVTEVFRHLQRLSEAGLVQKDVDGSYSLTPLGELALSLLSGLDFASKNSTYFVEHDVSCIPREFLSRIGELSAGALGSDVMTCFRKAEIMAQEVQEYMWILSDQILTSLLPIIGERVKSGIEFRFMFPENLVPPPGVKPVPGVQRRILPKVETAIVMTKKDVIFYLPDTCGKIDYVGFISSDAESQKWAKDLYLHYWDKAKPTANLPQKTGVMR